MKQSNKQYIILGIVIILSAQCLQAENILRILEGYGRDSIATFSTRSGQAEAAKLFNLILEPDGKVTAEKAEEYFSSTKSQTVKAYLSVMLADYSFVNNAFDSGLRYMKRAVDEYDPIRNDSYYRSVLSRAQKDIKESPGKAEQNKSSVLSEYNPPAIKEEPVITEITPAPAPAVAPEAAVTVKENMPANDQPIQAAIHESIPNFRIQVGAFSVLDNAEKKKIFFENHGYPVEIVKRERSNGFLYLIRVGAYDTYDQAKNALVELKEKYPAEEGIVIKVEK